MDLTTTLSASWSAATRALFHHLAPTRPVRPLPPRPSTAPFSARLSRPRSVRSFLVGVLPREVWTRADVMNLAAPERAKRLKAVGERVQAGPSSMQNVLTTFAGR
jgi:hypothetical protein